jgi:hypothetical protein
MLTRVLTMAGFAGALALAPVAADAQGDKKLSLGLMGGLALPVGDLSDGVNSGFNVTGNVWLPLGSTLKFRGDIGYDSFEGTGSTSIAGFDLNVLSLTGNVVFPLGREQAEGGIRPYLIGGGGLYRSTYDVNIAGFGSSSSGNDPGFSVGGGFEFQLSGFSTFAEARFVNVFGGDAPGRSGNARWMPITFGIRF